MPNPPPFFPPQYENVETVLLLARSLMNDTFAGATNTPGEGRIFIDSAPFIIPLYNNACRHLQRDLDVRVPGLKKQISEVLVLGLTPLDGPLGYGAPDPSIQPWLGFDGYWDGGTLNQEIRLPTNLLLPIRIWERGTGTLNPFVPLPESADGLPSYFQNVTLGNWEWRLDKIYFVGATQTEDIRLRYEVAVGVLPTTTPTSDFVKIPTPWMDSGEALAYHMAYEFCQSQLPVGQANDLMTGYRTAMLAIAARLVRTAQHVRFAKTEFGEGNDGFNYSFWP